MRRLELTTIKTPADRARKNETIMLQALAAAGQNTVAIAMGVNESTISRFKDGGITQAAALIAHCGLKVVPAGVQCFDPEYVASLRCLAEVGIRQQAPKLDFRDDE